MLSCKGKKRPPLERGFDHRSTIRTKSGAGRFENGDIRATPAHRKCEASKLYGIPNFVAITYSKIIKWPPTLWTARDYGPDNCLSLTIPVTKFLIASLTWLFDAFFGKLCPNRLAVRMFTSPPLIVPRAKDAFRKLTVSAPFRPSTCCSSW